jgi:hypothetical protein
MLRNEASAARECMVCRFFALKNDSFITTNNLTTIVYAPAYTS